MDGRTEAIALPPTLVRSIKTQKQPTPKKEIESQRQMLMMRSIDQEIGALNRQNNAIMHPLLQIPDYVTVQQHRPIS